MHEKKYYAVIILDNLKHDKLVGKNIEKNSMIIDNFLQKKDQSNN